MNGSYSTPRYLPDPLFASLLPNTVLNQKGVSETVKAAEDTTASACHCIADEGCFPSSLAMCVHPSQAQGSQPHSQQLMGADMGCNYGSISPVGKQLVNKMGQMNVSQQILSQHTPVSLCCTTPHVSCSLH